MVKLLAAHLLWRHIGDGAQSRAWAGQVLVLQMVSVPSAPAWLEEPRSGSIFAKSEIQDLGMSSFCNEDVAGLDVTMHDPLGVRSIERVGDFSRKGRSVSVSIARPAMRCFNVIPSRNSIDEEWMAILFTNFMDRADIGMIQS